MDEQVSRPSFLMLKESITDSAALADVDIVKHTRSPVLGRTHKAITQIYLACADTLDFGSLERYASLYCFDDFDTLCD